jgi:hypothetical protein
MMIVSIMMQIAKRNMNTEIDWNALDICWAEQYEEDYGHLFNNTMLNNHRISISVSNIEAGMLASA